jgi:hypothetical protein
LSAFVGRYSPATTLINNQHVIGKAPDAKQQKVWTAGDAELSIHK